VSARSFDVVVVGAGIIGSACAREFAEAGLHVALIESEEVGGGATAAAMGHIAVMDDSDAQFALTRYSQLLWKQLAERLPADAEYFPCGAIWVAVDDVEMAEVFRKQQYYGKRGAPVELLDPQSLAEAEPKLRPGLAGALRVKDDVVINPPSVARFLAREAQQFGADLILGRRVIEADGTAAKLDNGLSIAYERVVLANGVGAASLARGVTLQRRKGHLALTARHPGFLRHQIIELGYLRSAHAIDADSVAFNVQPRASGQVLIGSSRQYGVEEPNVDENVMSAMFERAFEYMPDLRNLSVVRSWTGFRAATADRLPLIGPCPGAENVYLATGHEGLGITMSLGTAKLLGDMMLGRKSAIARDPYLPGRECTQ
jgi:D-hydroxyproline dehydrogenase subunit beta